MTLYIDKNFRNLFDLSFFLKQELKFLSAVGKVAILRVTLEDAEVAAAFNEETLFETLDYIIKSTFSLSVLFNSH